jgi:hypothetical protein
MFMLMGNETNIKDEADNFHQTVLRENGGTAHLADAADAAILAPWFWRIGVFKGIGFEDSQGKDG